MGIGKNHSDVYKRNTIEFDLDEPRKVCSFRGNKRLWKAFVAYCKERFGSTCHVLEPFEIAVLLSGRVFADPVVTIENLNVRRVVQRHRRVYYEGEAEANYYDSRVGEWKFIDVALDRLNVHGHVSGCGCTLCRGIKVKSKRGERAPPKRE